MSGEQIAQVIKEVLSELGIEKPAPSDKGKIMKVLMPKVKGKADGKVVNQVLDVYKRQLLRRRRRHMQSQSAIP